MSTARHALRKDSDRKEPARPPRRIMLAPRGGNFVRDTYGELKKVVWPTREQTVNLSIVVIAVSLAVGVALGLVDWIFTQLVQRFLSTPPIAG